jgi:hypothetical protein
MDKLPLNPFDKICVDFVWMPSAYLASGIFYVAFFIFIFIFFSSLPLIASLLRNTCCIYIPANDLVFRSIILNWIQGGKLAEKCILRFIGLEQAKGEIILVRATSTLPLHKLKKASLDQQLLHFCLSPLEAKGFINFLEPLPTESS